MSTNPDSGAHSATRSQSFHSDDTVALQDYRSLSVLALLSLVIGLASPLCFAAPLMRTLPLIGIAVALVALRQIAVSDGLLAGRGAALAGLALCVASLAAVLSYGQVERLLRTSQAEDFAQKWIALLQSGDTEQAFRLTVAGSQPRPAPDEPGAAPQNPYDQFVANSLVEQLAAVGKEGQVRPGSVLAFGKQPNGSYVIRQKFTVTPSSSDPPGTQTSPGPIGVLLALQRARLPGEGQSRWLVLNYQAENGGAAAEHDHSHDHDH